MFDLVLHQPQIPPNTGNIIRLCANSGANLHLIEPLGFRLDEKSCRRAGLDYKELAKVKSWPDFDKYKHQKKSGKIWLVTKYGESCYSQNAFQLEDSFVFGSEQHGLPPHIIDTVPPEQRLALPMRTDSRSLNLSNAVAIILYEAWRQQKFIGSSNNPHNR
ncbi:MAG: tRNA (cytidine(34)-2'-O)-methyltransferase [Candidatus Puniceispirillaceae bacterium]|jgi:tRNA (cytidine/uridine-2'-O-)-methyltransferase